MREKTLLQRFEAKFTPEPNSGCWLWTAAANNCGYGVIKIDGDLRLAHRVSLELYGKPIPDGFRVCHKCDVPSCVNPDHLFSGTQSENIKDMVKKGRANRSHGETHALSKLKQSQVDSIRSSDLSRSKLAEIYGVSGNTIRHIQINHTWKE
jgi:hypothetical protein